MNAITTVLSSVGNFSDTTKNQYFSMLSLANEILRQVNDMISFVQGEKNKIEKQLVRVQKISEEISVKTRGHYIDMESAYSDYQYYSDKYFSSGSSSYGSSYSSSYSYSSDDDDEEYYKSMRNFKIDNLIDKMIEEICQ